MANLVVHFEIHASQPQALIDFYGELFGWTFAMAMGGIFALLGAGLMLLVRADRPFYADAKSAPAAVLCN